VSGETLAEALRRLQAGDAPGALEAAAAIARAEPKNVRAWLVAGVALRTLERIEESRAALERAALLDPRDYAPQFELGVLCEGMGQVQAAAEHFQRAAALRPQFAPARYAALRALGRLAVRRAGYARAAELFAEALAMAPDDPDLPLFLAQVLLLLGRFDEAWVPYAMRDSRRAFEAQAAAAGRPYRVPDFAELAGADVTLVAEQGLGDSLFFLRYAPALKGLVRRIAFAGEPRLAPILARTGLFDAFVDQPEASEVPLLVADLPRVLGPDANVYAASLSAAPTEEHVREWRARLEAAGPRPWLAVTWRAGTRPEVVRQALSKNVPVPQLFAALAEWPGTVFALQRGVEIGELAAARAALGRPVHDLSRVGADLEDVLAIVACVDRHVGVSSTNMHLAALAGATADVLVPFPPEWRWRPEGNSPWFPGFRVHRQAPDGDWSRALARVLA
jgi:tetratricopeptide (TPR) repeat protein